MTPGQQGSIDEKIIDGQLIEAIGLYRSATGCGLAEAEQMVRGRAAQLSGGPATSTAAEIRMVKPPLVAIAIFVVVIALIPIVIVGVAFFGVAKSFGSALGPSGGGSLGTLATLANAPGKLGGAMLVREPYYGTVVKDIESDSRFRAALGSPIAIDESAITCRTIRDGYTARSANCTLPVRGPRGTGDVTVAVVDQPGSFGVAGQLTTAGRTIEMGGR